MGISTSAQYHQSAALATVQEEDERDLSQQLQSHWSRFLLVTGLDRAAPSRSFLVTG